MVQFEPEPEPEPEPEYVCLADPVFAVQALPPDIIIAVGLSATKRGGSPLVLFAMRHVCQRWHESIDADLKLWEGLALQYFPQVATLHTSDPESSSVDFFKLFAQLTGLQRRGYNVGRHLEQFEKLEQVANCSTVQMRRAPRGPAVLLKPFRINNASAATATTPLMLQHAAAKLPPPQSGGLRPIGCGVHR
eukprot:CAMPEP_0119310468 /NCGR_PEP_ID=MMETSP1333-20130426/19586_1 /TAXON_ID=418940 /ORGANISM="Scyphosphaera apsteinii, Strain RCC1455" /LENGTH=190 /DNA_ID=CAMNT_0007314657 /DNA_START=117 /DNA_END=689 /DNA_ORIENTATION=+